MASFLLALSLTSVAASQSTAFIIPIDTSGPRLSTLSTPSAKTIAQTYCRSHIRNRIVTTVTTTRPPSSPSTSLAAGHQGHHRYPAPSSAASDRLSSTAACSALSLSRSMSSSLAVASSTSLSPSIPTSTAARFAFSSSVNAVVGERIPADASEVTCMVDLIKLLHNSKDPLWELLSFESMSVAAADAQVSSILHSSVLSHHSLEAAVISMVANKMHSSSLGATELSTLTSEMFEEQPGLVDVVAEDLIATATRAVSVPDALTVFLYHKGFACLTGYRVTRWLWLAKDRRELARYLQSVISEVFAADIHPGARIGRGVYIASGNAIVIGETAVVGDDVCCLQGVTLGGTGKERGDRHPKVGRGVLLGAGASVLGNIAIGEGSRIEAGSVVVKPVEPYSVNRGVPSKLVKYVTCDVDSLQFKEDEAKERRMQRMVYITYQQSRFIGM